MEILLGLGMFYAWAHSVVIIFKKTKGLTGYEQGVLIAGLVGAMLYFVGTLS